MKSAVAAALPAIALDAACAAETTLEVLHAPSAQAQPAPAANFSGNVAIRLLAAAPGPNRASLGLVTFAPGAHGLAHAPDGSQVCCRTDARFIPDDSASYLFFTVS